MASLPDNPYLRPDNDSRGRTISNNGEEVYYSDSDDDTSFHSKPNKNHVQMWVSESVNGDGYKFKEVK